MDEVIFEKKRIKAISNDTRSNILKLLRKRQYTLTEIAKLLNLSKPSIKKHLELLEEVDLIEKIDSQNKWIYYKLTQDGEKLNKKEGVRVLFMFAISSIATMLVGAFLIFSGIAHLGESAYQYDTKLLGIEEGATMAEPGSEQTNWFLDHTISIGSFVILLIASISLLMYWNKISG